MFFCFSFFFLNLILFLDSDGNPIPRRVKVVDPAPIIRIETEEEKSLRLSLEAEAKEKSDEDYLISKLPIVYQEYILCLDTLKQNRRFTENQLQNILRYSKLFTSTLERIDREYFKEERNKRATMITANKHFIANEKSESEREDEYERINEELETAGKPITAEDVSYRYRTDCILNMKSTISEWSTYIVFRGPLQIIQAVAYMLDYPTQAVVNASNRAEWSKIKLLLGSNEFFQLLNDYDPRQPQVRTDAEKHATVDSIKRLIQSINIDSEELKLINYPLYELRGWVLDALDVKRRAEKERKEAKRAAEKAAREEQERLEEERRQQEEDEERKRQGHDDDDEERDETEEDDD